MLSATVNKEVYERFFGNIKTITYEIKEVKYKGKIYQHTDDGLRGKNLLVLGTPFYNEKFVKILAVCLDYSIDEINNSKMNHRLDEYDEFTFY